MSMMTYDCKHDINSRLENKSAVYLEKNRNNFFSKNCVHGKNLDFVPTVQINSESQKSY